MNEILLERLLTNKFTFGFELEGFTYDESALEEKLDSIFGPGGNYHGDCSLSLSEKDNDNLKNNEIYVYKSEDGEWNMTDDDFEREFTDDDYEHDRETINYWLSDRNYKPYFVSSFEYSSPVLDFIPANIKKIWEFFNENLGRNKLMFTNDSCGFHHHISFEGITGEDAAWIMCKLALDNDAIDMFSTMKHSEDDGRDYDFNFLTGWSSKDYLSYLKDEILNFNFEKIAQYLNTQKYSLLNNHSNKTLEWRGPRNFLDTENITDIKNFYKQLWKIILWMSKTLDTKEINGMSKQNFLKALAETDRYGKGKPLLNYPHFKLTNEHLLNDENLNTILSKIDSNPDILNSLASDKRICDQVIQKLFSNSKLRKIIEKMNKDKISQTVYDLSYKYIPAVMAYNASEDAIYRTTERTFIRLLNTRFGINSSELPTIIEYIVPKIDANTLNKLNFEVKKDCLNKTSFKTVPYFFENLKDSEKENIFTLIASKRNSVDSEILLNCFEQLPDNIKNKTDIQNILLDIIYRHPSAIKYIDEVSPYMLISIIGGAMKNGNNEAEIVTQLLNSGKISKDEIESAQSYFTRFYKHNFNDEY